MSSRSLTFCLAGLIAVSACAADEPAKDAAPSVADQIAAIKKEHQELQKKFYADLSTFRKDNQKISDLNAEYSKAAQKQAEELMSLIRAHGKEPAAFEGILVLVGELTYYLEDDLVQLVLEHHLVDPKMGQFCFDIKYRSGEPWALKLLKAAAAKHPQKDVRGQALYALGVYHRLDAEPDRFGGNKKLSDEETAKRLAEATKYFTEVVKDYAAVATPDGKDKLGEEAANELVRIKNLPNLKIGKKAPDVVGEDFDGKKFSLRDYHGKVVLLDFWGHW